MMSKLIPSEELHMKYESNLNIKEEEVAVDLKPLNQKKHCARPNKASMRYIQQEKAYSELALYQAWPLTEIANPHEANDVLFGRGGKTNHHEGNIRYRGLIDEKYRDIYEKCTTKTQKTNVAMAFIQEWRTGQAQGPPGRFLKFNPSTALWEDVGDRRAREKISQALRESKTVALRGGRRPCKSSLYVSRPPAVVKISPSPQPPESPLETPLRRNRQRAIMARAGGIFAESMTSENSKLVGRSCSWTESTASSDQDDAISCLSQDGHD